MRTVIKANEWERIEEEASSAKYFLTNPRFQFIRDYLENVKNSARDLVIENRILDTREELTISQRIKRILFKPKESEINEMVGAYKAIKKIFSELQTFIDHKEDLIKQENARKIRIERNHEA